MKKAFALLGFLSAAFAVFSQYSIHIGKTMGCQDLWLIESAHYFSYMTIWTNLLVAMVFGAITIYPQSRLGRFLSTPAAQAGTMLYIIIVGLVYHFMLSGMFNLSGQEWFNDLLLHYINPLLFTVFWFIYSEKERFGYSQSIKWLVWPVAYFFYSLIRGFLVGWYPYPFVDVNKDGYPQVLTVSLVLISGYALTGLGVVFMSRKLAGTR
jgi:hypothetical protein